MAKKPKPENKQKNPAKTQKKQTANKRFVAFIAILAFLLTAAAILTGDYSRGGYSIEIGKPSPARFVATRDIENTVATERLREDARRSVTDIYTHDLDATDTLKRGFAEFFSLAFELRRELAPIFTPDAQQGQPSIVDASALLSLLTQPQIDELAAMDTATFNNMRETLGGILDDILDRGVRPDTVDRARAEARESIIASDLPQSARALAYAIIDEFIQPNNVYDEAETERRKEEKAAEVQPVICLRNQKIVDENEIITEEAYEMLLALGFISRGFSANLVPSLGAVVISLIIFIFVVLYMNHFHADIMRRRKTVMLIFTLYISVIILAWVMAGDSYFLVPILTFTMLISMLISHRLSIFLNFAVTVITFLIFKGNMDYLVFYLISGTAVGYLAVYTTQRNKIILVGLLSALVNIGVVIGYSLFYDTGVMSVDIIRRIGGALIYSPLAGLLSVILATGSLPVWEALFGVITPLKLLDLTNPSNKLLSRMTIEAPGTYHHSLIVANLAETAAHDIGANPAVARVGGYYHDIGKLKYPQYFSENMADPNRNPHDTMKIYTSIAVIKSHVGYGLEMANEHKLPAVIKEIIASHHGTTLLKYFYFKTKNEHPDVKINEDDFRYDYPKPSTPEAAVVMLSDTVEAAVRSKNPAGSRLEDIEQNVRSLIKDKLDDGQLEHSGLLIKDLDTITHAFMRVFKGMYHERIPYPTDDKGNAADPLIDTGDLSEILERT